MWDLPGPGLEPVSPALAGRFLTTLPPGKSPPAEFLMTLKDKREKLEEGRFLKLSIQTVDVVFSVQ